MTQIVLTPEDDVAARLREAERPAVTAVVIPGRDPLALAAARAAVEVVAVERAPDVRVNAVLAGASASPAAVEAAAAYLAGAHAVTGQWLEVA